MINDAIGCTIIGNDFIDAFDGNLDKDVDLGFFMPAVILSNPNSRILMILHMSFMPNNWQALVKSVQSKRIQMALGE